MAPSDISSLPILGAGAYGSVHLWTAIDGTRLAVKQLHPHLARDPEVVRRFLQEATVMKRLNGQGVPAVSEVVQRPDATFFAMEYFELGSLQDAITRRGDRPFPPAEAKSIANGICKAMQSAHAQKIVHRDLKPSNILFRASAPVKERPELNQPIITDFGLARILETRADLSTVSAGTIAYMAPEQEDGRATLASDIFALGVIIYQLYSGRLPYSPGQQSKKRQGVYPAMSSAAPVHIIEIVRRALSPNPLERPSLAELTSALTISPLSPAHATPAVQVIRDTRVETSGSNPWLAFAGVGLIVWAIFAGIFIDEGLDNDSALALALIPAAIAAAIAGYFADN